MKALESYCSWCYEKTTHRLVTKRLAMRDTYECENCKNQTLECRFCSNMAKGQPCKVVSDLIELSEESQTENTATTSEKANGFLLNNITSKLLSTGGKIKNDWHNELCAEHDGSIASFEKLTTRLDNIEDYLDIFKRDKLNIYGAAKIAGFSALGVVAFSAMATPAAPAIASSLGSLGLLGTASTGTVISTLSGAALTSASLAAIGGSMAAGAAIITASGAALGGVYGGVISNGYICEDKSFRISKLRTRGDTVKTIFINGFTQENEVDFYDWQVGQLAFDPTNSMYSVNWSSKTNAKLGAAFAGGVGKQSATNMLKAIAASGSKNAAKKLGPVGIALMFTDLINNPWHKSMLRAAQAGVMLAEAISRTKGQTFNLVGHSLGCRVIFYALEALATKDSKFIGDVIMLGGAVGKDDQKAWNNALLALEGTLYNCHSIQDKVLGNIYRTVNAGLSHPIGLSPIEIQHKQLKNVNCDHLVESHMKWKKHYEEILKMIYPFREHAIKSPT
jgi:hypothetical protein